MNLEGKRALVTGGSEGIGRSIAEALIERGSRVAVTGRRQEILDATAKKIGAYAVCGDVSVEAQVKETVEQVVAEFGGLDILVNNAGVGYFSELADLDVERFEEVFATNVTGAMLMAREVAPHFIRQKSGNILNISSTAGLKGFRAGTAYVGTKFALKGMTECWRDELRPHNIRVILVNPSEVQTGFGGRGEPGDLNPKKLRSREIADAVVGALLIDDRGFIPEFSVFATNPF
jgi:3-oxoacyl-[acyl-carrier protein] reductase